MAGDGKKYRVVIPPTAKESLREIIEHIKNDSPTASAKVRRVLIELARSLTKLPERFAREEYLSGKEGNYRSVTKWHYKIVYKIVNDEVVILRFIHTSRDPEQIKEIE